MPSVALTAAVVIKTGVDSAPAAADVDGNNVGNNGKIFLLFKNTNVATRTVTFDATQTVDGLAVADRTLSVPTGERMIGPFKPTVFGETLSWTYSAVADLTVKALSFTADPN